MLISTSLDPTNVTDEMAQEPVVHSSNIPLVDLAGVRGTRDDQDAALEAGRALVSALKTAGFAYLTNHGIPQETIDEAFEWSKKFFSLPQAEKDKAPHPPEGWWHRGYSGIGREKVTQMVFDEAELASRRKTPDFKESFEIGREDDAHLPNIWLPESSLPGFRAFFTTFYDVCYALELDVLRAAALGMGLDGGFFRRYHANRDNQIRLLHYPPVEERLLLSGTVEQLGAHTDFGSATLLFQDAVGGLEVEDPASPGRFVAVPCVPGTVVVNVGDFMQRWTNDTLRSTMHRVRMPPLEAWGGGGSGRLTKARYSIPYFIGADQEKTVDCVPGCFGPGRPKKYEPINSREYIERRLNATY
ncbi:2-oxoglutarate-dependent dioxygenase gloF [Colletotrichum orbiculare MAFF 240422]|uniref:2-oxoglutarate-dependent dioxygenase gloF n=1 Tax=Colletotrichum orbiculare (strain 104-T / ATCC 96160 / CBS 514.97 / LARS 414 / MAFF 240422) TaxID=1213857 RepID=N4V0V9_COLOR|nr:2-oxoglutarate-dependent dioxygenase gloF [Colletotrichum orbiculare MAFF 240422]